MSETPTKNSRRKAGLAYFWREWWGLLVVAFVSLVFIVFFAVLVGMGQLDTGFDEYTPPTPDTRQAKTLWDWMDLILVPYILGAGAALFTWVTNKRARDAEEKRIKEQREIELDRSREAALQAYLDRMTELMRDGLLESRKGDENRGIARARTLTVLRQLDGERKGLLLHFLCESDLIVRDGIVDLSGADLARASLIRANLYGADLSEADLGEADLHEANLGHANLFCANLERANLSEADLSEADLHEANLERANLERANLYRTSLHRANLYGANLKGGYLIDTYVAMAKVTDEQLGQAEVLKIDR